MEEPGAPKIKAAAMATGMGALQGMKTAMRQRAMMTSAGFPGPSC
jgi:hypothetical protein